MRNRQATHSKGTIADLWSVSRNLAPLFEQLVFPCWCHRHLFFSVVFPTIWKVLLGQLCQSDILLVSSNGGCSDPRKLFFAGFLNNISAWTTLRSLSILITSNRCVKNPDYHLSIKLTFLLSYFVSIKMSFSNLHFWIIFKLRLRQFSFKDFCASDLLDFLFRDNLNSVPDSHL